MPGCCRELERHGRLLVGEGSAGGVWAGSAGVAVLVTAGAGLPWLPYHGAKIPTMLAFRGL